MGAFGQNRPWQIGLPSTYGMHLEGVEEAEEEEATVIEVKEVKIKTEMDRRCALLFMPVVRRFTLLPPVPTLYQPRVKRQTPC